MKAQAGQSMVELAVALASLATLVLGGLSISGLQEIDRRMVMAAREVAWTESWAPGVTAVPAQVRRLHAAAFSDAGARDAHGMQLLVEQEALSVTASLHQPGGVAGAGTSFLIAPLRTASGFLGESFDLSGERLVRGSISARIAPGSHRAAPFDELDLQLRAPFALLGDAWHAAGPLHVHRRAAGLVPTGQLQSLRAIWAPLSVAASLLEPSLDRLCFGLIEAERIPEDRLGPGRTPLPGACP